MMTRKRFKLRGAGDASTAASALLLLACGASPGADGAVAARWATRASAPEPRTEVSVATDDSLRCGIYLQGGTEHTHGITSSLLSNTAVRVGEILDSLLDRDPDPAPEGTRAAVDGTGRPAR